MNDLFVGAFIAAIVTATLIVACGTSVDQPTETVGRTATQTPAEDTPPPGCEFKDEKLTGSTGTARVLKCKKP